MSNNNDITPIGFVTFQTALARLVDASMIQKIPKNDHHTGGEESSVERLEILTSLMRDALFHKKLVAFYYVDDELKNIPAGAWRKIVTEFWIQDGERCSNDGHIEKLFIKEHDLQLFLNSPDITIQKQKSNQELGLLNEKSFYVSPFMALMIEAIVEFDIPNTPTKKETLIEFFKSKTLPNGTKISKNHARNLATFCRPAESMKGGLKRRPR